MSTRKLDLALTLGIVLEVLEILRRLPGWLLPFVLVPLAMVVSIVVYLVYVHPWWTVAALLVALALRRIRGRPRRPA